jgi:imidazolonepropionase-like amidohydrolase
MRALAWLTLAILCAGGPGHASTTIRNVVLLHPATGEIGDPSTVVIEGDRIVALGREGSVEVPAQARSIDATGHYLIPGLWDLHTHVTYLDNRHSLPLFVTQGVTGVRELGSVPEEIERLRAQVLAGEVLGPRIVRAGPTLNGARNGPHHRVIDSPEAARQAVKELREAGVDLLKTHNATDRETYFALLEAARAAGLSVAGHIPKTVSPLEACTAGQASVEHVVTIFEGTHMAAYENEMQGFKALPAWLESEAGELVECFAEHQTLFVPTLRTYEFRAHRAAAYDEPDPRRRYFGGDASVWPADWEPSGADRMPMVVAVRQGLVDAGIELVRQLHARGAPIGTGTDFASGALIPGFDLHAEIRLLAKAGLSPAEALWASCRGPGEHAGGDPLQGRLAVGAPADLVLLRRNAFESLAALDEIEAVVLRGDLLDRARLDEVLGGLEGR